MKPYFSVVTPNFNCAKFIGRSYSSLLAQSDVDWEWVVVDDGSSDNSVAIFKELCAKDPRIKFHAFEKNRGRGAARSYAVQKAIGEIVVIWDIDDLYVSTRLAAAREAFKDGADFFCSYALVVDNSLNLKGARHFAANSGGLLPRFVHPTLMLKRKLFEEISYDPSARAGEDMAVMIGLEQGSYLGNYCEKYLMLYFEDREINIEKTITSHNSQFIFCRRYIHSMSESKPALKKWLFRMRVKGWLLRLMSVAPSIYLRTVKYRYMENVALKLISEEHVKIFKSAEALIVGRD